MPLSPAREESVTPKQLNRKKRDNLPKRTTDKLKEWMIQHWSHPYPTEEEKAKMAEQFQLSLTQVNNWFINGRRRFHKKYFMENNITPMYTPKRGPGKSLKRRRKEVDEGNDTSSSPESSEDRESGRRYGTEPQNVQSTESCDTDSSLDRFDSLFTDELISDCVSPDKNLLLLAFVCTIVEKL